MRRRVSRRSSNRSDPRAGWPCRSVGTFFRRLAAPRTRTAVPLGASGRRRSEGARWLQEFAAARTWTEARRTAAPPRPQLRAALAARPWAPLRPPARAQGLAEASARRPPLRLKPGDSRSPDKIAVTPGSLCRSGYTSPTIAQSLVLRFITSIRGGSESEQLRTGRATRSYQRASGSRSSRVSSKPMVWARPKPK